MGDDLLAAAFSKRNTGGIKHLLPGVLAALSPDDAKKLRQILEADKTVINWPALRDEMTERGHYHPVSTWIKWSDDYHREPERFGG